MPTRDVGQIYWAARAVASPLYKALYKVRVEGAHNVPRDSAAIVAANHISFFDTVVLMLALPRRLTFVGKADYLDDWKTKWLFPAIGMIPIDRTAGRQARAALDAAAGALERGELFGIYPEGTRSRDGKLHKGHAGVAHLAIETGAPIVPVGLIGTDHIQPPGASVPKVFMPAVVRFGDPIEPAAYALGKRRNRQLITDDLMVAIGDLSGQQYSDEFSSAEPPLIRGWHRIGLSRGRAHRDKRPVLGGGRYNRRRRCL